MKYKYTSHINTKISVSANSNIDNLFFVDKYFEKFINSIQVITTLLTTNHEEVIEKKKVATRVLKSFLLLQLQWKLFLLAISHRCYESTMEVHTYAL